jgi:hypothetical protein
MARLLASLLSLSLTLMLMLGGHVAITLLFVYVVVPNSGGLPLPLYATSYLALGWIACIFNRFLRQTLAAKSKG